MIIVHHFNESRSQRILWLLEELQLPYEICSHLRDPRTNRTLAVDAPSGADIQLNFVGEMAGTFANRTAYPHLGAWMRKFQTRPAYLAALKHGGPYKF